MILGLIIVSFEGSLPAAALSRRTVNAAESIAGQRRDERHGDARQQHVVAEDTSSAEQEHTDEPGRGDHRRADDPAGLAHSRAGQGANTDIEAEPGERRGHRLDDDHDNDERHCCLLSPLDSVWCSFHRSTKSTVVLFMGKKIYASAKLFMKNFLASLNLCWRL